MVATFLICGLAASPAAAASTGCCFWIWAAAPMRSRVTKAPNCTAPPSLPIACSPAICLMFTRRLGVVISSFIRESRSLPPASISTSPQLFPSRAGTCSGVVGLEYSNGRIAASFLIERGQDAVRRKRQKRHAHANCIGYGIGNGGHGPDGGRFSQADRTTLVIAFASHHVDNQFPDIADAGKAVEVHIGVEHLAQV